MVTDDGVVGFDLRTGARRWNVPSTEDCSYLRVFAGAARDLAQVVCGQGTYGLVAFDPATGRQAWQTQLSDGDHVSVTVLSADPAVVDVEQSGPRGVDRIETFDATGRPGRSFPISGLRSPDGPLDLDVGGDSFDTTPVPSLLVTGGLLVGIGRASGDQQYAQALRLSDGSQAWQTKLRDEVSATGVFGDHLLVLEDDEPDTELVSVALSDGSSTGLGHVDPGLVGSDSALVATGAEYFVVNEDGTYPTPPVGAISH